MKRAQPWPCLAVLVTVACWAVKPPPLPPEPSPIERLKEVLSRELPMVTVRVGALSAQLRRADTAGQAALAAVLPVAPGRARELRRLAGALHGAVARAEQAGARVVTALGPLESLQASREDHASALRARDPHGL